MAGSPERRKSPQTAAPNKPLALATGSGSPHGALWWRAGILRRRPDGDGTDARLQGWSGGGRRSLSGRLRSCGGWLTGARTVWQDFTYKDTAYALADRDLIMVERRRGSWPARQEAGVSPSPCWRSWPATAESSRSPIARAGPCCIPVAISRAVPDGLVPAGYGLRHTGRRDDERALAVPLPLLVTGPPRDPRGLAATGRAAHHGGAGRRRRRRTGRRSRRGRLSGRG
jgi:hypothetical protein